LHLLRFYQLILPCSSDFLNIGFKNHK
jgi:hypothetical protein